MRAKRAAPLKPFWEFLSWVLPFSENVALYEARQQLLADDRRREVEHLNALQEDYYQKSRYR